MEDNEDLPLKYERSTETTSGGISVSVHTDRLARSLADGLDIPYSWVYEAALLDFCKRYNGNPAYQPGAHREARIRDIVRESPRW